jgi:hypothetical protein
MKTIFVVGSALVLISVVTPIWLQLLHPSLVQRGNHQAALAGARNVLHMPDLIIHLVPQHMADLIS